MKNHKESIESIGRDRLLWANKLIERMPEHESAYERSTNQEVWKVGFSDGSTAICTLHQSQIATIRGER